MKKYLLCSIGSRGDMEPFLALGQELMKDPSNVVAFCFPVQFEALAKEVSPHFYPQDKSFLELLDSPEIKKVIGQVGSGLSRLGTMITMVAKTRPIQQQMIIDQAQATKAFQPDEIIYHLKCVYPVFWGLQHKGKTRILSLMPCTIHRVKHEPHVGFGNPHAEWWNKFTYLLSKKVLINKGILDYGKQYMKDNGLNYTYQQIEEHIYHNTLVEYPISTQLFPRPAEWPSNAIITGFRERDKMSNYQPDVALEAFLAKYPNPLYIGFGSMVNSTPAKVGSDIVAVCEELNQPVVVNSSWGGIEIPDEHPNLIFRVKDVPFDYLFPKVRAVVHHGGSGTTHSAYRVGKKQLIIPHIADQFFWNRQVVRQNAGVAGFPIKQWERGLFKRKLVELLKLAEV